MVEVEVEVENEVETEEIVMMNQTPISNQLLEEKAEEIIVVEK